MKYKDIPLLILATILIALSTYHIIERNDILMGVEIGVFAIYTITYVIICIKREKRLEGELKASADMNVYWLSKKNEAENKVDYYEKALIDTNELNFDSDSLSNLRVVNATGIHKIYNFKVQLNRAEKTATFEVIPLINEPFADDSQPETQGYICTQCNSSNVRETAHYVICNDCGKRKKKSTYGVKLTKK